LLACEGQEVVEAAARRQKVEEVEEEACLESARMMLAELHAQTRTSARKPTQMLTSA
jgi:hypothetical protein